MSPPVLARSSDLAELPEETLLVRLAIAVLRQRRIVAVTALVVVISAVITTMRKPHGYTSESSFMPQTGGQSASALAGLASQFGITLPQGGGAESPAFYADLLTTRGILDSVAAASIVAPNEHGMLQRMTIGTLLGPKTGTPAERQRSIEHTISSSIRTDITRDGVVRVSLTAGTPAIAQQMNQRLLAALQQFNLDTRQSQAAAERRFVGQRLSEVGSDLRAAEDRLLDFLERNRSRASDELHLEQDRLNRQVSLEQQLYVALAQSYETAKMEEVRDTPVLTIIEQPDLPTYPNARGTVMRAILALILGSILGVLLALVREYFRRLSLEEPADYEEFTRLSHETMRDLSRPWRLLPRKGHAN